MTPRTPSILTALLFLSLVLGSGCDEEQLRSLSDLRDAEAARRARVGAVSARDPGSAYTSFLASPGGRSWALGQMNGGSLSASSALAASIEAGAVSADSFADEPAIDGWSVHEPAVPESGVGASLASPLPLRDLLLEAASEPGMDDALLALLTGRPIGDTRRSGTEVVPRCPRRMHPDGDVSHRWYGRPDR